MTNLLSDAPELFPIGHQVAGRYEIERHLGQGGMGTVYLAKDLVLGEERIALKILHPEHAIDSRQTQRFLREVQLMRKINHRSVVRTFDVGVEGTLIYFTMEYIDGISLEKLIADHQFPKKSQTNLIIQICDGLEAIHKANIIHRDLKPENIIVLQDGSIKITDFGIARPERSTLTAHNEIIGSAIYIAPEVWLGNELTPSLDLYSLGIILYELNTGEVPFDCDETSALMRMHLDQEPRPPKELNPTIPSWINKLILRLLAKSPKDRPRSAKEIIDYVRSHTEALEVTQHAHTEPKEKKTSGVPSTFLDRLEEITQQGMDKNRHKRSGGAMYSPSKDLSQHPSFSAAWSSFVRNLPLLFQKQADFQRRFFIARSFFVSLLITLGAAAIFFWSSSWLLSNLFGIHVPLEVSMTGNQSTSFEHIQDSDSLLGSLLTSLPLIGMVLMSLGLPLALIPIITRSFVHLRFTLLSGLIFQGVLGLALAFNYLLPNLRHDNLSALSYALAASVSLRQLIEIALLCPVMTTYRSFVTSTNLTLQPAALVSVTDNIFLVVLLSSYLLLITCIIGKCFARRIEKSKLFSAAITLGIFLLFFVENSLINQETLELSQGSIDLWLLRLEFPTVVWRAVILNWGLIYAGVGVLSYRARKRSAKN